MEIRNEKGLHLTAAALFVGTADRFKGVAEVTVTKDGQSVNGHSIMGILTLGAEQGSHIEVVATGPQASEAMAAIRTLVENRFNEEK
jgi:phosphocarrier protein